MRSYCRSVIDQFGILDNQRKGQFPNPDLVVEYNATLQSSSVLRRRTADVRLQPPVVDAGISASSVVTVPTTTSSGPASGQVSGQASTSTGTTPAASSVPNGGEAGSGSATVKSGKKERSLLEKMSLSLDINWLAFLSLPLDLRPRVAYHLIINFTCSVSLFENLSMGGPLL